MVAALASLPASFPPASHLRCYSIDPNHLLPLFPQSSVLTLLLCLSLIRLRRGVKNKKKDQKASGSSSCCHALSPRALPVEERRRLDPALASRRIEMRENKNRLAIQPSNSKHMVEEPEKKRKKMNPEALARRLGSSRTKIRNELKLPPSVSSSNQ